ncbi:MAG: hypothetical protein ACR2PK_10670 [Acidimicrobiales bacterium]
MGCFIFLMALTGPRVALFFVWIGTTIVDRAFNGFVVPFFGFLFLPWTTLIYALVYDGTGVSLFGWLLVALGVLADISSYGIGARRGYTRTA